MFFLYSRGFVIGCQRKTAKVWQKVKMVNLTCNMLIPKKRFFSHFGIHGELQPCTQYTVYTENCHPKGASKNIPSTFLSAEKYQNKKTSPQRCLPPKINGRDDFFCVQMPDGCSPLFAAAACNHLDVVKYLLCAGADKDSLLCDGP